MKSALLFITNTYIIPCFWNSVIQIFPVVQQDA
jgi:hypothetical protein